MALLPTTAPYRQLWKTGSNVAEARRYLGSFRVSLVDASVAAYIRPSAGSAPAVGAGDLFNVAITTAGQFTWTVQLTETVGQPIFVACGYNIVPTTAGTGGALPVAPSAPLATGGHGGLTNNATTGLVTAFASMVDSPSNAAGHSFDAPFSNTFFISLVDVAGTIPSSTLASSIATGFDRLNIWFEVVVKPTAVPASL